MRTHLHTAILLFLSGLILSGIPAHAQMRYSEVSFKDSLIQTLFQYGREVYFRGIDPQEAAFVFQRILVLDCHHNGAQEFLDKIQNKFPNVSVRISGCSKEEATDISASGELDDTIEGSGTALRRQRQSMKEKAAILNNRPAMSLPSETLTEPQMMDARATPLLAFSKPIDFNTMPPQQQLETAGALDDFPIIDTSTLTGSLTGYQTGDLAISQDCAKLRLVNDRLSKEITQLKDQIKFKDEAIIRYQKEIAGIQGSDADSPYALISQDQKDLIRIQQENIDYLETELAASRDDSSVNSFESGPAYDDMRRQIASAQLTAKENEMYLEARNREAQLLQKQLGELQEQLRLVKRILGEKNDIIKSLQDELEALQIEND